MRAVLDDRAGTVSIRATSSAVRQNAVVNRPDCVPSAAIVVSATAIELCLKPSVCVTTIRLAGPGGSPPLGSTLFEHAQIPRAAIAAAAPRPMARRTL
jgi:hypothetical protein